MQTKRAELGCEKKGIDGGSVRDDKIDATREECPSAECVEIGLGDMKTEIAEMSRMPVYDSIHVRYRLARGFEKYKAERKGVGTTEPAGDEFLEFFRDFEPCLIAFAKAQTGP
jgi:hypothetical protein